MVLPLHLKLKSLNSRRIITALLFSFACLMAPLHGLYAFSDQSSTERFLKENKYFFNFANISVTNFGTEEDIKMLKKTGQYDFWAQIAYLQSNYKRAYRQTRKSQKLQVKLYGRLIDKYLIDTKVILDRIAPMIIRSKDARARLYLSLGYRDITESKSQQVIALHSAKKLFSYKIKRFIESINLCRRGKRYAILAILEARTPREKKKGIENLAFEEIGAKILELQRAQDKEVLPEYNFLLHHTDNFGKSFKRVTIADTMLSEYKVQGLDANFQNDEKVDFTKKDNPKPVDKPGIQK